MSRVVGVLAVWGSSSFSVVWPVFVVPLAASCASWVGPESGEDLLGGWGDVWGELENVAVDADAAGA